MDPHHRIPACFPRSSFVKCSTHSSRQISVSLQAREKSEDVNSFISHASNSGTRKETVLCRQRTISSDAGWTPNGGFSKRPKGLPTNESEDVTTNLLERQRTHQETISSTTLLRLSLLEDSRMNLLRFPHGAGPSGHEENLLRDSKASAAENQQ